jgi:hypothetical protein
MEPALYKDRNHMDRVVGERWEGGCLIAEQLVDLIKRVSTTLEAGLRPRSGFQRRLWRWTEFRRRPHNRRFQVDWAPG